MVNLSFEQIRKIAKQELIKMWTYVFSEYKDNFNKHNAWLEWCIKQLKDELMFMGDLFINDEVRTEYKVEIIEEMMLILEGYKI